MLSNPTYNKIFNFLEQVARFISISLILYIFISHVSGIITSDKIHFDERMFNVTYLKFLLITAFITGIVGMIYARLQGKKSHITFSSLYIREKITIFISAIFLSVFFVSDAAILFKFLIPFETFLLSILLPRLIGFYANTQIKQISNESSSTPFNFRLGLLLTIGFTGIAFGVYIFSTIFFSYISGQVSREVEVKKLFYIKNINPEKTTYGEKVTIEGYNFGWKSNDQYKLMNTYGEIPSSIWTNENITFDVPLHLKEGVNEVWVQKPYENQLNKVIKSNKVKIDIVSQFVFFPLEDEPLWKRGLKKIKRILFFKIKFLNNFLF